MGMRERKGRREERERVVIKREDKEEYVGPYEEVFLA